MGLLHPFVCVWVTCVVLSHCREESGGCLPIWKCGRAGPAGHAFTGQQESFLWAQIKWSQENPCLLGNLGGTQPLPEHLGLLHLCRMGRSNVEMLEEDIRVGSHPAALGTSQVALKEPWRKNCQFSFFITGQKDYYQEVKPHIPRGGLVSQFYGGGEKSPDL